jgi:hypothetical protein
VAIFKVKCSWKTGGRESGRERCSQTPNSDTLATAGNQATAGKEATTEMLATARIPAATGTPALSKEYEQEKARPQQQKCQQLQQQDLCGKAMKMAGNDARNITVNMAVTKENLVAGKGAQVAGVFAGSGNEGLQGSGSPLTSFTCQIFNSTLSS